MTDLFNECFEKGPLFVPKQGLAQRIRSSSIKRRPFSRVEKPHLAVVNRLKGLRALLAPELLLMLLDKPPQLLHLPLGVRLAAERPRKQP